MMHPTSIRGPRTGPNTLRQRADMRALVALVKHFDNIVKNISEPFFNTPPLITTLPVDQGVSAI